jgi:hypothetical protein
VTGVCVERCCERRGKLRFRVSEGATSPQMGGAWKPPASWLIHVFSRSGPGCLFDHLEVSQLEPSAEPFEHWSDPAPSLGVEQRQWIVG